MSRRVLDDAGVSLIESVVAMVVLLVGLLGILGFTVVADSATTSNLGREGATVLARDVLERSRLLIPGHEADLNFTDDPQNVGHLGNTMRTALPDAAATTPVNADSFTIKRRNQTYTVTVTSCLEDQLTDGRWFHDALFCDEQAPQRATTLGAGKVELRDGAGQPVDSRLLDVTVGNAPAGTAGYVNSDLVKAVVCPLLALVNVNSVGVNAVLGGPFPGAASLSLRCVGVPGGVVDPMPQDLARMTVKIAWTEGGKNRAITQSALIANPQA